MRPAVVVLCMAPLLFHSTRTLALEHGSIRFGLNSGIAASTASEEYGGLMVLPGTALAIGGGVAGALVAPVWGVADVSYFRVGPGEFTGRTFYADPIMEPSSAVTAMVGLELAERGQAGLAPFVSGSLGVGHVSIGEMNSDQGTGTTLTERTKPTSAPAFAVGFGLRTATTSSGLNANFGIRWVSILTDGGSMNIVPFTIGIEF